MGVPALFRWLTKKYPKIITPVIEETPFDIDGVKYPVDTTKPNPNGEELHNLYLDFNGIVHPCSHPENKPPPADESEMMMAIFEYTERVVNMVRPRRLLYIAIDGVAPRAKMNQQRARRFRSQMDAKEADEKKAELQVLLRRQRIARGEPEDVDQVIKKTWDSNVITPGTPFMFILAQSIRFWCQWKLNTDPAWAELKVIISDASVPGEGEHKIMQFIRSQRSDPDYDPNTRHVMYGLDADLIMLGIATHEPHFRVLREDVSIQDAKAKTCRLCGQPGHYAENCRGTAKEKSGEFDEKASKTPDLKPFVFLNVPILREYLGAEMYVPGQTFRFDLERALDDWVFMCFFVGNDFLPHLPSLDIHEDGIDKLIAIWRDNVPIMGGYLTCDGEVDLARAQVILQGLAKQEDAIFRKRRENDERRERNQERRKRQDEQREQRESRNSKQRRGSPDYTQGANALPASEINYNMVVNRGAAEKAIASNKSAAAVLKEKMLAQQNATPTKDTTDATPVETPSPALGKRKAELMANGDEDTESDVGTPGRSTPVVEQPVKKFDPDNPPPDTVKLWEEGYADRYYEQKFHVSPTDIEFRRKVANAYVEGLSWVLLYYFQGCPSWTWYYPYHYAPFAADFQDIDQLDIKFDKGKPFKPYEQLMGVLPASSNHAIPKPFHPLMTEPDSDIVDFYPEEFDLDMNGKKQSWKAIVLLPFIDEKRLLAAMATKYPELSEDEHMRNELGKEALLISDKHPLYNDLAAEFYSKKKAKGDGPKEVKLSMRKARVAGQASKNDIFLPHMDLRGPEEDIKLDPEVDDDCSMAVHYDMPPKTHVHKSMLFPGVVLPPPVLDKSDVAILKSKARNSGRDFGGAPLYDNSRRDHMADAQWRQPRVNYAADRPPLPQNYGNGRNGGPPPPPDPRTLDPSNPFAAFLDPKFAPGMPGARIPPPAGLPPQGHGQYQQYGNGGYDTRDNRGGYGRQDQYPPAQYGGYQQPQYPPQQGGQYDNRRQDGYGRGGGQQNGGRQNYPPQQNPGYYQGGQGQNGYGRR
ncbi:5'-3' exoribonuclease 2 [Knufia obscura]|uniref:5'-3' exoribonuclease n=2 Tax=Knufia TaxID=430999 RepID=A0AAN8EMH1_9EURO|nr:5'-3' exoribonuclease 2 [Knufia obscura]KAK5954267.1 5'-3' exoribonuclease 2 [Knufia fluminis]